MGKSKFHDYILDMNEDTEFRGAKLALFVGSKLAVIMRDDKPGLVWAGHLDLPGGGREGTESPEACVLRETREELGISVSDQDLIWRRCFRASTGEPVWFFAAHLPEARAADIQLGDEGQYWQLMSAQAYFDHPRTIPHFAERVKAYLKEAAV